MKKFFIPLFSFLLVLTLLLGSFGSAKAEIGDDPMVTPISGDMEFTTEVVPIAALPGTIELASQMLAPVGFPAGEAQIGGSGIRVKGMDSGKATVCFTLATIAIKQGWGGKVGVWNGTKWVQLPTTIKTPEESSASLACATISGSGTYAFIKYIVDATLLPKSTVAVLPECDTIGIDWDGWGIGTFSTFSPFVIDMVRLKVFYPSLTNTPFEYFIIDANVPLTGDLHGSAISDEDGMADFTGFTWTYTGTPITSLTFTIHVVTPVCYHDFEADLSHTIPTGD